MCWGITPTELPIWMVDYVYETQICLWCETMFMERRIGWYDMICILWCVLYGQWTRIVRARVRLPSDGYAGAPGSFGLGGNYVWYLWCTSFGWITTVQCYDKL
ncbi:hypothetical protein M6B38_113595 [Iris pallida]|uniref:Uncharacterized protein n=1 Tax=Iris pallida TaxID=29817 RepID=A0AAX6IK88_IRIPA|nr:hypothetical protein M6B38_113595 [Iris pallida]